MILKVLYDLGPLHSRSMYPSPGLPCNPSSNIFAVLCLKVCYVLPREVMTQCSFWMASYPWACKVLDEPILRTGVGWHGQSWGAGSQKRTKDSLSSILNISSHCPTPSLNFPTYFPGSWENKKDHYVAGMGGSQSIIHKGSLSIDTLQFIFQMLLYSDWPLLFLNHS